MRLNSTEQCFFLLNPGFDEVHHRYTISFVRSVVNAIFHRRRLSEMSLFFLSPWLRDPSNLLLPCQLAVSDMLVGVIVQLSYVAFRLHENHERFVP